MNMTVKGDSRPYYHIRPRGTRLRKDVCDAVLTLWVEDKLSAAEIAIEVNRRYGTAYGRRSINRFIYARRLEGDARAVRKKANQGRAKRNWVDQYQRRVQRNHSPDSIFARPRPATTETASDA